MVRVPRRHRLVEGTSTRLDARLRQESPTAAPAMAARVISACGRGRVLVPLAFLPTLAGFALVAAIERVKITNAPGGAVVVASGFDSGGGVCIHEVLQGSGTIDVTGTL